MAAPVLRGASRSVPNGRLVDQSDLSAASRGNEYAGRMRRLGSLFLRRDHNTQWQDAVLARLDSITASQNQLRKELAEHSAEGRPTPSGRLRATSFLAFMAALIIVSVSATIISSTFQSQASTSASQAQTAFEQSASDLQPIENIVDKHGVKYLYAHVTKSLLADTQAAGDSANQFDQYTAEENDYDLKYFISIYAGQIVLAISSACFGAVAGWLLIPAIIERRRRGGARQELLAEIG
jgi:hypothetical protein